MDIKDFEHEFYLPKSKRNKGWIERNHFYYNRYLSYDKHDVYSRRSIVWRYGSAGVLEAEYSLYSNGEVTVNVYDAGTRSPYASWYCRKYGKNDVIDIIDNKIIEELERMGVKKRNE